MQWVFGLLLVILGLALVYTGYKGTTGQLWDTLFGGGRPAAAAPGSTSSGSPTKSTKTTTKLPPGEGIGKGP